MPYILKDLRPPYDVLIKEIIKGIGQADDIQLGIWANDFKNEIVPHKPELQDGEFNYFLTKLFISLNWIDGMTYYSYMETAPKIKKIIMECLTIYTTPEPSYYRYNRAIGMLNCCLLEFRRRYGNERSALPTMFIQMIIKKFYEEIGIYEDLKITLNGNV